jgi:2-polyprenyl-3-methyl-5-hydroxy-6-metoxy-1,4-benzoquinol methylase
LFLQKKFIALDFEDDLKEFNILYCPNCEIGMTSPYPSEATVSNLYMSRSSKNFDSKSNFIIELLKDFCAKNDIKKIRKKVGYEFNSILDFGTGNGRFAYTASKLFPKAQVDAVDFADVPPELLKSLSDKSVNYIQTNVFFESNKTYDLIILRHVLEHVHEPVRFMAELKEHLNPNGIIWIEVPNLNAGCAKIFGKFYNNFYVPYHILHFTEKSLKALLKNAGFNCIMGKAEMPIMSNNVANLCKCRLNNAFRLVGIFLHPFQVLVESLSNSSTILTAIARKDNTIVK